MDFGRTYRNNFRFHWIDWQIYLLLILDSLAFLPLINFHGIFTSFIVGKVNTNESRFKFDNVWNVLRYKGVIFSHFSRPMLFIGNKNVNVSFTLSGVCNPRKLLVNQLTWWPEWRSHDSMRRKTPTRTKHSGHDPKPTKTALVTRLLRHVVRTRGKFRFGKCFWLFLISQRRFFLSHLRLLFMRW